MFAANYVSASDNHVSVRVTSPLIESFPHHSSVYPWHLERFADVVAQPTITIEKSKWSESIKRIYLSSRVQISWANKMLCNIVDIRRTLSLSNAAQFIIPCHNGMWKILLKFKFDSWKFRSVRAIPVRPWCAAVRQQVGSWGKHIHASGTFSCVLSSTKLHRDFCTVHTLGCVKSVLLFAIRWWTKSTQDSC